jgi:2-polyprenyl-3-methyl-5-hydroxy-6-metoxy-1,4-benzoquinol methylase
MTEESDQTVVVGLLDHVLQLIPGLRGQRERGIDFLDVGCGSGHAAIRIAERFPASRVAGYDLCENAVQRAPDEAHRRGVHDVRFERRDLTRLDGEAPFDVVTAFDAVHDQARPESVLSNVWQALRRRGTSLVQDIRASSLLEKNVYNPVAPFLYTISCMHCMSVSLSQGGRGLGAAWGEELALEMLAAAGLEDVGVHRLEHDIMNNWYGA